MPIQYLWASVYMWELPFPLRDLLNRSSLRVLFYRLDFLPRWMLWRMPTKHLLGRWGMLGMCEWVSGVWRRDYEPVFKWLRVWILLNWNSMPWFYRMPTLILWIWNPLSQLSWKLYRVYRAFKLRMLAMWIWVSIWLLWNLLELWIFQSHCKWNRNLW